MLARRSNKTHTRRGQSMVEMALILPLLVLLLSVVIEGGLALNAWLRVSTAARDATRFVLDEGRPDQAAVLVLQKLHGIDFGTPKGSQGSNNMDVYIITGATDNSGNIPLDAAHWSIDHRYNPNGNSNPPTVTNTLIRNRLQKQGDATNIPFVIVEVDFRYTPLLGTLISPNTKLPMMSYAIMQNNPSD